MRIQQDESFFAVFLPTVWWMFSTWMEEGGHHVRVKNIDKWRVWVYTCIEKTVAAGVARTGIPLRELRVVECMWTDGPSERATIKSRDTIVKIRNKALCFYFFRFLILLLPVSVKDLKSHKIPHIQLYICTSKEVKYQILLLESQSEMTVVWESSCVNNHIFFSRKMLVCQ